MGLGHFSHETPQFSVAIFNVGKTLGHFDSINSLNSILSSKNCLSTVCLLHLSEYGARLIESAHLLESAVYCSKPA